MIKRHINYCNTAVDPTFREGGCIFSFRFGGSRNIFNGSAPAILLKYNRRMIATADHVSITAFYQLASKNKHMINIISFNIPHCLKCCLLFVRYLTWSFTISLSPSPADPTEKLHLNFLHVPIRPSPSGPPERCVFKHGRQITISPNNTLRAFSLLCRSRDAGGEGKEREKEGRQTASMNGFQTAAKIAESDMWAPGRTIRGRWVCEVEAGPTRCTDGGHTRCTPVMIHGPPSVLLSPSLEQLAQFPQACSAQMSPSLAVRGPRGLW